MTKRKRAAEPTTSKPNGVEANSITHGNDDDAADPPKQTKSLKLDAEPSTLTIQVVTGSYERVLHGFQAHIPTNQSAEAESSNTFTDTFLFNAHTSAIRCLSISPPSKGPSTSKPRSIVLATGSTDERVNLYSISASPASSSIPAQPKPPHINGKTTKHAPVDGKSSHHTTSLTGLISAENPLNRELGSLYHHSASITALYFLPTRGKLLTAADDNTIAVVRTRDWAVLSTFKAPIPRPVGRPSGDTAAPGEVPAGINGFAIHPSSRLLVSVNKGEKCMRLWNLVTGKKAGVLNFGREMLQQVGPGRFGAGATGEGQRVEWNAAGEEFVIGFERGAVVYGMDSKPRSLLLPKPPSKIHQIRYLQNEPHLIAISTEDGRILFFNTEPSSTSKGEETTEAAAASENVAQPAQRAAASAASAASAAEPQKTTIPPARLLAQLGGKSAGVSSRIKDFELLQAPAPAPSKQQPQEHQQKHPLYVVSGSSDGIVRIWSLPPPDQWSAAAISNTSTDPGQEQAVKEAGGKEGGGKEADAVKQVGRLLGMYETRNRITCLRAFVMSSQPQSQDGSAVDGMAEHAEEEEDEEEEVSREESDSD